MIISIPIFYKIKKRNLQQEAKAHIAVQEWIDQGGLKENCFSREAICKIHYNFCHSLPEALLWVEDPDNKKKFGLFREPYVRLKLK